jgi:hypothetical protein
MAECTEVDNPGTISDRYFLYQKAVVQNTMSPRRYIFIVQSRLRFLPSVQSSQMH